MNTYFDYFDRYSKSQPEQVFLEHLISGKKYSYGEVFGYAKKIVSYLNAKDMPESVALLANSDIDSVVAYCGIVCSGRTVVVLDESVTSVYRKDLTENHPEMCVEPSELLAEAEKAFPGEVHFSTYPDAHQIESVLFTSGSTGEPKIFGIPSDRHGIDMSFDFGGDDYAVLNFRRTSTTPFRRNLGRTVLNGGRFLTVDLTETSPTEIDERLGDRIVTEISVTPTMVRKMFPLYTHGWTKHVRVVHLNGERITRDDLEMIFEKMPQTAVRIVYGLTEFGSITGHYVRLDDMSKLHDPISAGLPIIDISIRDEDSGVEVPAGDSGSILVREASGYVGELNPDGQFSFTRYEVNDWQTTGDEGFINEDGELVVLGRTQQTLKIRGSRISLLEVEDIIQATGLVREVMVASYTDARGNVALGALIIPQDAGTFSLAELRRKVSEKHSLVMCPTRVICVEQIPVLVSGKLDRVTASKMLNEELQSDSKAVDDPTIKVVVDIVSRLLSLESLSPSQDFFEVGLDSLGSLELLQALSDAFGLQLDVRVLLENPTCFALADALTNYMEPEGRLVNIAVSPERDGGTVYWILPGANPYMIQKMAIELADYSHFGVLNHGCLPDDVVLIDAGLMIDSLVHAIMEERSSEEGIIIGGFSSAGLLASEVARLLSERGVDVKGVILLDPTTSTSPEVRTRQRLVNPLHLMLGREGRLSTLDPVQRDHALFGLQVFALASYTPQPLSMPVLHVGNQRTPGQKLLWSRNDKSQFAQFAIDHLDYLRKPTVVAETVSSFLRMIMQP